MELLISEPGKETLALRRETLMDVAGQCLRDDNINNLYPWAELVSLAAAEFRAKGQEDLALALWKMLGRAEKVIVGSDWQILRERVVKV